MDTNKKLTIKEEMMLALVTSYATGEFPKNPSAIPPDYFYFYNEENEMYMTIFTMAPTEPDDILDQLEEPKIESQIKQACDLMVLNKNGLERSLVMRMIVLNDLAENYVGVIISNKQIAP